MKYILLTALVIPCLVCAQLRPGFDPREYIRLLEISNRQIDTPWKMNDRMLPEPAGCRLVYRSPVTGLDNRWDLWLDGDSVGIISIRGSVGREESWLENFYCAMVPATGILQLNDSTSFHYKLAEDFKASVHVGWLIGMASLAPTVVEKVKEYKEKGVRSFIIMGHSQGGSIAFLLRSYLYYLDKSLVIKTYCSAASKPGNQYYAYDFDFITRGGWGLRVVNTRDWVPETPFSIQTLRDMNPVNPLAKESFFSKIYLGNDYKELDEATTQAAATYRKDLGEKLFQKVRKFLPELVEPKYDPTMNYTPAGTTVVLPPYPGYDKAFVGSALAVMVHHGLRAYYELTVHDY
ncbi:lipase family protein [Dinghuibacter silviterrae]|uniref:Lipase (Class 3) n=1 Tax=Dinghuibacter silviterrae TaxID=1539049 RepID=A0A4R8DG84_9BACT|nr:lipase family protein [Dinghuibacter silviterrae]TDW96495.1 lipase (class 3) [Dinghuibacter silviterrae]